MRLLLFLTVIITLQAQPMYGPFSANPRGPIQADGQYPRRTFTLDGIDIRIIWDGLRLMPIVDFSDKNDLLRDVDAVYLDIWFTRPFSTPSNTGMPMQLTLIRSVKCPAYPVPVGCDSPDTTIDLDKIQKVEMHMYHRVRLIK